MPIPKAFIRLEPLAFGLFQFIRTHGGVNSRSQCNLAHNFHGVRNHVQRRSVSLIDEITSACVAFVFPSNTFAEESLDFRIIGQAESDASKVQWPTHGAAL